MYLVYFVVRLAIDYRLLNRAGLSTAGVACPLAALSGLLFSSLIFTILKSKYKENRNIYTDYYT